MTVGKPKRRQTAERFEPESAAPARASPRGHAEAKGKL